MVDHEQPDQEPEAPSGEYQELAPKGRKSFGNIKRELTEEELGSPAVQKLLIDELERLEEERTSLVGFRAKFYSNDKELGILGEKLNRSTSFEIISGSCLVVGAAALGYAPNLWQHQPSGYISIVFGLIVVIGGIWAKAVRS